MTRTQDPLTASAFDTNNTPSTAMACQIETRPHRSAWITFCLLATLLILGTAFANPAAAFDPTLGCQDWSWVGLKEVPDEPCPNPGGGWIVAELFADPFGGSPDSLPELLKPFCYYEHPLAGDAVTILELNGLSDASRSCLTVSPAAGELAEATWPLLAKRFATHTGIGEVIDTEAQPVRLALLDTAATRESGVADNPGNSSHGYSLANMAESLVCDGPTCLAQLTSRLALPYLTFDPESGHLSDRDDVKGGYLGTLADLALAVWAETRTWSRYGDPDGQRLVINLSLGWDGELFGGLEEDVEQMPVAVQAVHRVLEMASCQGALLIAAAGNDTGGPNAGTGPLLPGAWEKRAAPDFQTCQQLGITPNPDDVPFEADPESYRPLVYAVGGVDPSGSPLANARPGGMPRLAAYGRHGVVESHVGGKPTATLTGTSVASIVTASAASAVWYYQPELPPHEVMERIYDTAQPLSYDAEFHFETGALPPRVRQVSLCKAVEATCPEGSQCLGTEPRCLGSTLGFATPDLSGFLAGVSQTTSGLAVDTAYPESALTCDGEELVYDLGVGLPLYLCPHHQLDGVALDPWVSPQPGSTPCPNCTFDDGENAMYIEISPDYQGTLSNPILKVGTTLYSLDLQPLTAGEGAVVEDLDHVVIAPANANAVTISFTVDNGTPQTSADSSPVLVLP